MTHSNLPHQTGNQYNDSYQINQAQLVKSFYKVAIKVPNIFEKQLIKGMIIINSSCYLDKIEIPLTCNVSIPKLVSERMLTDQNFQFQHMKFILKNPKRQDFKISFRNKGSLTLFSEFF